MDHSLLLSRLRQTLTDAAHSHKASRAPPFLFSEATAPFVLRSSMPLLLAPRLSSSPTRTVSCPTKWRGRATKRTMAIRCSIPTASASLPAWYPETTARLSRPRWPPGPSTWASTRSAADLPDLPDHTPRTRLAGRKPLPWPCACPHPSRCCTAPHGSAGRCGLLRGSAFVPQLLEPSRLQLLQLQRLEGGSMLPGPPHALHRALRRAALPGGRRCCWLSLSLSLPSLLPPSRSRSFPLSISPSLSHTHHLPPPLLVLPRFN